MYKMLFGVKSLVFKPALVSVVIPTVRQTALVERCLTSLKNHTVWPNLEVVLVDDGSSPEVQARLTEIAAAHGCQLILKPDNTGFAKTVNIGTQKARGAYLVLVNNDIIFIDRHWLRALVTEASRGRNGVVGARLLYPDRRIQHAGVYYLPEARCFDHLYRHKPGSFPPALQTREVLAVTGALMLVRRETWDKLGGMAEEFFVAYEDVDFCLRAWQNGWRVAYCGKSVAIHTEGATRGTTPQNKDGEWYRRELEGWALFQAKWLGPGGEPIFPYRFRGRSQRLTPPGVTGQWFSCPTGYYAE